MEGVRLELIQANHLIDMLQNVRHTVVDDHDGLPATVYV